jgi:hypothetical protein
MSAMPDKNSPKWKDLVTGKTRYEFQSLATKILMGRLILKYEIDPSPNNIDSLVEELYKYFTANPKLAESDIKKVFG